jgi:catechol 2,3-dioxygenase-like lactoylglutathione lyase family enzyme
MSFRTTAFALSKTVNSLLGDNHGLSVAEEEEVPVKKLMAVALWLAVPLTAWGLSARLPADPPFTSTGAFFALYVADLNASTRWYTEKLGLKVTMRTPKQGKAAVTVLEGGGLMVELIQHDDAVPRGRAAGAGRDPALIHGLSKAGFLVEDFERTMAALKERNVQIAYGPFPATATQRANAIIRDHAGNLIQLFGK